MAHPIHRWDQLNPPEQLDGVADGRQYLVGEEVFARLVGLEDFEDVLRVIGAGVLVTDARQVRIAVTVVHLIDCRRQGGGAGAGAAATASSAASVRQEQSALFARGFPVGSQ